MKIHPRELTVQQAHNEIDHAVTEAISNHPDLTYLELLAILNQIAAAWIKYGLKDERQPDEAIKPGEEETNEQNQYQHSSKRNRILWLVNRVVYRPQVGTRY